MRLNTTLMTTAALIGLIATTPVLAQDTTPDPVPEAVETATDQVADTVTGAVETGAEIDVEADAMVAPDGYAAADLTTFTVDQLMGVDIYGPSVDVDQNSIEVEGEFIGNITNLVLAEDQAVSDIITDVGGFLGIGQKSVAIPAEHFTLFSDADGNLQGRVTLTREEIEALPEYVPPTE